MRSDNPTKLKFKVSIFFDLVENTVNSREDY